MSLLKLRGVVIKQSDYGEGNRILNIFTKEQGIIKAVLYGAKSIKNKNSATGQFLTYGDFILTSTGRDIFTVRSCEPIECFFKIHEDIQKLSLCAYFADLCYALINLDSADANILSLLLNCFYALSHTNASCEKVKVVFELRVMAYSGYMPNLYKCTKCAKDNDIIAFSPRAGGVVCEECRQADDYYIDDDVYHAIGYILTSGEKKMLSFIVADEVLKKVGEISERYVSVHSEKSFKALEYYKRMSI